MGHSFEELEDISSWGLKCLLSQKVPGPPSLDDWGSPSPQYLPLPS